MRRPLLITITALALSACGPRARAETIPHPDRPGASVEYFKAKPEGAGPWPTIVLLHGHQNGLARPGGAIFEKWGVLRDYAGRGYLAVSVSLPGYGGSSGPEDFAGPFTQHAVEGVIARLVATHQADPDHVLIEGVSLGAVTGALIGTHDPKLAGLVLISGLYDLPAFFAHPKSAGATGVKAVAIAQTGGGDTALRERSALQNAASIKAATLILNGAQDDRTDSGQAERLAAQVNAAGGHAQVHIYPAFGHEIPVKARQAEIDAFIDRALKR